MLMLSGANAQAQTSTTDPADSTRTQATWEWDRAKGRTKRYGASRVTDNSLTEYEPLGLRLGSFTFYPSLETRLGYDSNTNGSSLNPKPDNIVETRADMRLHWDQSRHSFDFAFGGRFLKYTRGTQTDRIEGYATAAADLQINHAHSLNLSAKSEYAQIDAFSVDRPGAGTEPLAVWHHRAGAGFKRDAGRLWAALSLSADTWRYQPTADAPRTPVDYTGNNLDLFAATATMGYRFSPGYELITKLRGLRQHSPDATPGTELDAFGMEALAGVSAEINPLLTWQIMGGYTTRDFDRALPDLNAFLGSLEITWLPISLLTVNARLARKASETATAAGATGIIDDSLRIKMDYEAMRNLIFTIQGEYHNLEFIGTSRTDQLYAGQLGIQYLLNRNITLTLQYEHQLRESKGATKVLQRDRIMLGGKLRF